MAKSLKTKYLLLALAVGGVLSLVLTALAYWEHRVDAADVNHLTYATVAQRLEADLETRASSLSEITGSSLAPALSTGNKAAVASIAERLLDERDIEKVEVLDAHGALLFSGGDPAPQQPGDWFAFQSTIHSALQSSPVSQLGTLRIWMSRVEMRETLASIRKQLESQQGLQIRRMRGLLAGVTLPMLLLGLAGAWFIARQLSGPIEALVESADRIGQGDYSMPLAVMRQDELGELQFALERMRQKLNETTITKNYLNTVLNSLSDAVLVTSPEGIVKSCNEAAQRLLGYREADLVDKPLIGFIDDTHRRAFEVGNAAGNAAAEARETVLRTASGQTIPVSIASSEITTEDPQFQGHIYVARNITERKRAERRIRYLARYDTLTKMPNRMQFQHLLQQAIARARRSQRSLALLYLDLDRFKEVNDTFGHAAGDRTLEILSERLTRNLSKDTVIGRLAGDEFAMFIDDLPMDMDNRASIGALARTLLDEIGRTFYVNQQEVYLTASVGIAICPYDAENVIDLIRNADAAMYHSKQNGGNSSAFYVPEMNAAAVERLMLKAKLRRALERDEFVLLYQSKVDLRSGRVVGAEALLRWRLPGHGDISPSQFIPLAEETSLILDIGEWVLNRVCSDYRQWQKVVPEPGRIAINLSLRQLKQSSFIARCRNVFRKHEVSPTCFELEVTETTLMTDPKRTIGLLNELYAMGLNLAIDDFGTGYSSLSALQQFPIGTLKIDQSFVRDVAVDSDDAAIVRTILDMGKSLDIEVIAEGVEAAEQLEFLRQHGCAYGQGRLFGEPMEAGKLLEILASQVSGAHHADLCAAALRPIRLSF
ncbi:MAG TPA: EAL domain-containing protein [Steroidobacteraceae bacterium]|jgi:diguanylate cyclase (GGDEF)-like protein/PAS domain S-box-containing protein|nr:EAL domain-containing protein [Steroidobacteraceae bacterium]